MTWIAGLENITPITLDTTKPSDIAAAVEIVKQKTGGKLDFLVNNAARNHFKPILDVSADEMRAQFEVNYVAPISVTQAFAPLIIAVSHPPSIPVYSEIENSCGMAVGKRPNLLHNLHRRPRQHALHGRLLVRQARARSSIRHAAPRTRAPRRFRHSHRNRGRAVARANVLQGSGLAGLVALQRLRGDICE
jgi:hypothetical protein